MVSMFKPLPTLHEHHNGVAPVNQKKMQFYFWPMLDDSFLSTHLCVVLHRELTAPRHKQIILLHEMKMPSAADKRAL